MCVSSDIAIGTSAVMFTVSLSEVETVIDICKYTLKIRFSTSHNICKCNLCPKNAPNLKANIFYFCTQTINLSYNCELGNLPIVYNYCTKVSSVCMYPFHSKTHGQDFMINKLYALFLIFMLNFCTHCL